MSAKRSQIGIMIGIIIFLALVMTIVILTGSTDQKKKKKKKKQADVDLGSELEYDVDLGSELEYDDDGSETESESEPDPDPEPEPVCNLQEYTSVNSCGDLTSAIDNGWKEKCSQRYVVNGNGEKINCILDGDKCVDNGKCL